jgi:hypothetical protein
MKFILTLVLVGFTFSASSSFAGTKEQASQVDYSNFGKTETPGTLTQENQACADRTYAAVDKILSDAGLASDGYVIAIEVDTGLPMPAVSGTPVISHEAGQKIFKMQINCSNSTLTTSDSIYKAVWATISTDIG